MGENSMHHFIRSIRHLAPLGLLIVVAVTGRECTAQQTARKFATAEEAVQSVIKAAKANNRTELVSIFGAGSEDLFSSGDKVADRRARQLILVALNEKWSLSNQGPNTK